MNNVVIHDDANLQRLYRLAGNQSYKPATYTCITEFTPSFPNVNNQAFAADSHLAKPEYQPEAPYPRIYTDDYKKTLLSTL